ncbi:MAG: hypothetical protein LBL78_02945 [Prevotellaceae bacterium]|jgi:hypothetical protein|nr:hypothetical protein [Prevotellaceae bacterium]
MKRIIKRLSLALSALCLLLPTACNDDAAFDNDGAAKANEVLLTAQLNVAGSTMVRTRANGLTESEENAVSSVCALVFNKQDLYQYRATTTLSGNTVTAKMKKSADAADTYRVVFVANADVNDTGLLTTGMSLSDVQKVLSFATKGGYDVVTHKNLPMWGKTPLFAVTDNFSTSVTLIRSMARIDVSLMPEENNTAGALPYTLTDVLVYNNIDQISLLPAEGNLSTDGLSVKAPTLPDDAATDTKEISYSGYIQGDTLVSHSVYVGENKADGPDGKTPTKLVVGIKYNGKVGYYRIDIKHTATGGKDTERLPLLRNHCYKFTIKSVTGSGAESADDAANSDAWNVDWELSLDDIVNDGDNNGGGYISGGYYFKTTHEILLVGEGNAVKTKSVPFETNVKDFTCDTWILNNSSVVATLENVTKTGNITKGKITYSTTFANTTGDSIQNILQIAAAPIDTFSVVVWQDRERSRYDITNVKVHGLYLPQLTRGDETKRDYPLIEDVHTMTVTLRAKKDANYETNNTARWHVYTNRLNGYSFSGSGSFKEVPAKNQTTDTNYRYFTVTLQGEVGAVPKKGGYNLFTMHTDGLNLDDDNLSGYQETDPSGNKKDKSVSVLCGYHTKKLTTYAYWGGSTLGYSSSKGYSRKMVDDARNYGINGTVPTEGFARKEYSAVNGYNALFNSLTASTSTKADFDILVIGYDFNLRNATYAKNFKNFIDAGGAVILMEDGITSSYSHNVVNNLVRYYYAGNSSSVAWASGGSSAGSRGAAYFFPSEYGSGSDQTPEQSDYIMNGPFGELKGRAWGEDRTTTTAITGLKGNMNFVVYSRNNTGGGSNNNYDEGTLTTMFRLRNDGNLKGKAGLFFVGDGGFTARRNNNLLSNAIPFLTDANNRPIGNSKYIPAVYNATAFANALFWAIDYAEFYGPNCDPEVRANIAAYEKEWKLNK